MKKQQYYSKKEIRKRLSDMRSLDVSSKKVEMIKTDVVSAWHEHITNSPLSKKRFEIKELSLIIKHMVSIIVIAVILLTGGTGTALAADSARPGDALFGVDRALEQIAVNFSLSDVTKAERYLKIAQEREEEMLELLLEDLEDEALEAEAYNKQALANALSYLNQFREEYQDEQSGSTSDDEALEHAEGEFLESQHRLAERQRERVKDSLKSQYGEAEMEVEFENGEARISYEIGNDKQEYILVTTDIDEVITSLQQFTGLSIDDIKTLLKVEKSDHDVDVKDHDSDTDEDDDDNSNLNSNTNSDYDDEGDELDDKDEDHDDVNSNTNSDHDELDDDDKNHDSDTDEDDDDVNSNTNTDHDELDEDDEDHDGVNSNVNSD